MQKSWLIFLSLLVLIVACSPANRKNRIKYTFETANKKLNEGYYSDAVVLYSQVLEKDAEITDAYLNRGVAYYEMGKYVLALADYNEVYRLKPDYHDVLFNRAYAYLELERMDNAFEDLSYLRKLYPDTALVDVVSGLVFEKQRDYAKALESFSAAIAKDGDNFDAYSNRGIMHYNLGNYPSAQSDLEQALVIHQNEPYALNSLALVLAEQGELEQADSVISVAMNMVGGQPYFINNAGYIKLLQEEYEMADSLIAKSIQLDAENTYAYLNLGRLKTTVDQREAGIAAFHQSIALDSTNYESYQALIKAYIANGQREDACKLYQRHAELLDVASPCQ
ncbi:hypothetical protein BGP76_19325 [Reichenbachiella sp. MSK19-1]|nr:hypothetical protein BGP76_19325 [Reichenbachiella sp. MSK19-1]